MSIELAVAEQELDVARDALARVEHCADDTEALEQYTYALRTRNQIRKAEAAS